jgi:hypothetical protein
VGSWKAFADAYDDGATVVYRATDKSARTEYVIGTFNAAAGTLSRDTILGSTAGGSTPINWTGRTRVLVHALVQGLPLCDTPPMDGQFLAFDAATGEYCPTTITFPTPTPDDDSADMQDVTGGIDYNVTLTKPVTQVIWLSPDAGSKITNIPLCEASINGYSLDVKTTLANSDDHFIVPEAGTIAGLANLTFADTGCNAFLRCDAQRNDWVLRCLCCTTPMSGVVPPPGRGGGGSAVMTIDGTGDLTTYVDHTIPSRSVSVTTLLSDDVLVLKITVEAEGAPSQDQFPPSITGVSTPGLVWTKLWGLSGQGSGFGGGNTFNATEVWWAITTTPGTYTADISVNSDTAWFGSVMFGVNGADTTTPWDTNASLPASSPAGAMQLPTSTPTLSGISTTASHTMVLCFVDVFSGATPVGLPTPAGFIGGPSQGLATGAIQAFIGLGYDTDVFWKTYSSALSGETFTASSGTTFVVQPVRGWAMMVHALRAA